MNIWTVPVAGGTISVVIDLAHNEAGLAALLEIMDRHPAATWTAAAWSGYRR